MKDTSSSNAGFIFLWNLAHALCNNAPKQMGANLFIIFLDFIYINRAKQTKEIPTHIFIDTDKENKFVKFERMVISFLSRCQGL